MIAFLRWIVGSLTAVFVVLFAVSNRQSVIFYITPFTNSYEYPLYWIGLGFMVLGFLLGSLTVWLNAGSVRRTKRAQSRKIKQLEKDLEAANEDTKPQNPPSDFFPALPHRKAK